MIHILLVSTDTTVLELLRANSAFLNAEIKIFDAADDLIKTLRYNRPDVLIMDFILNDDNGGGLCHQIKSDPELKELPVIMLSDYTGLERLSAKFGCSTILNKPVNLPELAETLNGLNILQMH